jgi:threonine synthase
MTTKSTVTDIECRDCRETYELDLTEYPCRKCGGILDPRYDLDEITADRDDIAERSGSMWAYRELLPIRDRDAIVSMDEGDTPLVECPTVADRLGVERLLIKDEGRNPTNTFKDRGQAVAISAAVERDAETVALPSADNAGQAASAYAARAGLDCHIFLNHQAGSVKKSLVRSHGADLHLVDGNITDAGTAFEDAREKHEWYSVATFQTPFRHEGKRRWAMRCLKL